MFFKHFAITVQNTKTQSIRKAFQYKSTIKPVIIRVLYSLKHFNFTKRIRRSNVDFETAAISPLDKTTSFPRSSIFSRYCVDSPGRNFLIFLRSSSFDLPFRKDGFSFQRREIGVLNIQASSAQHHFFFIVVRVKAVLLFSTHWIIILIL